MTDLIDTTEMYLRTIYELLEEDVVPMRARITERLHQSGPTVSQTVARMERDGLLSLDGDRHIRLTAKGLRRAEAVMRKHRLAERMLVDVLGLEWVNVHDEACRMEHVISDEVERRIVALVPDHTTSPYGNPIPGVARLDEPKVSPEARPARTFLDGVTRLSTAVLESPDTEREFVVRRLGEAVQADDDVLRHLADVGVRPGAQVTAGTGGLGVRITCGDKSCEVAEAVAASIFVDAS